MSVSSSSSRTYFTVGPNAPTVEEFLAGKPATNQFGNMQLRLLHPHSSPEFDRTSVMLDFGDINPEGEFVTYQSTPAVVEGTYTGEGSVLAL